MDGTIEYLGVGNRTCLNSWQESGKNAPDWSGTNEW